MEQLPGERRELRGLEERAGEEDSREAGLWEITSPAFVVRDAGEVVAAAGYRSWPSRTAHISVLTAPAWRGRGLARVTGSAAAAHALAAGLLPQWRARVPASRRVAASRRWGRSSASSCGSRARVTPGYLPADRGCSAGARAPGTGAAPVRRIRW
ncbi:GNAT family N-acetyltransferase [Kitasatospora sp. NBC_01302]|uniref:GNAT family N-acetyltransferase n=1 Tax=Kitasatospora sp. NBC_01302 TaxID=2903575 RepID=UPI003FA34562